MPSQNVLNVERLTVKKTANSRHIREWFQIKSHLLQWWQENNTFGVWVIAFCICYKLSTTKRNFCWFFLLLFLYYVVCAWKTVQGISFHKILSWNIPKNESLERYCEGFTMVYNNIRNKKQTYTALQNLCNFRIKYRK